MRVPLNHSGSTKEERIVIKITLGDVMDSMKKAVNSKGENFVYERQNYDGTFLGCYYIHSDHSGADPRDFPGFDELVNPTPGCIVAWVLCDLGVDMKDLYECEGMIPRNLVGPLEATGKYSFDLDVSLALGAAQKQQDIGLSWGVAYASTVERLKSLGYQA